MSEELEEQELMNIDIDQCAEDDCTEMDKSIRKIKKGGPVDSMEEYYFACYLRELKDAGVIINADKNLAKLDLSSPLKHFSTEIMPTKTKVKQIHLLNGAYYTPDFNVQWSPQYKDVIFSLMNAGKHMSKHKVPFISCKSNLHSSIFEVKGKFMTGLEMNLYATKIKWLYDKERIFVQTVKIPDLFKTTFTPQAYMDDMTYKVGNKNKGLNIGDSRLKYKPVTCAEFLASLEGKNPSQIEML